MSPSAFLERESAPEDAGLRIVLGRATAPWAQLREKLASRFGALSEKWSYSGKAYGWSLQLKQKKRTILYLIPCRGYFIAAFALGEKACLAARRSGLPAAVLDVIDRAPKYPEGRGVRLEVRSKKDLAGVEQLAAIKMAN
jgi:hypothetical protein